MLLVHPLVPKVSEAISGDGLTDRSEVIWFPVGECQSVMALSRGEFPR